MNREDIIRMAREAGLSHMPGWVESGWGYDNLERFAALVAAHEREQCAIQPVQEPLGWAVQVGTHGTGRRRDKPRYTIFFDKAAAENLAYRTGTHPKPFYIGGNDD